MNPISAAGMILMALFWLGLSIIGTILEWWTFMKVVTIIFMNPITLGPTWIGIFMIFIAPLTPGGRSMLADIFQIKRDHRK